ncbi:MAG TPA: DUF3052 domain-containing protein [Solirubrobacteraceae bacterium]
MTSARPNRETTGSGTPLPKKLGIKPGTRLVLVDAPPEFEASTLQPMPDGVRVRRSARGGPADVIVAFHTERAVLQRRLNKLRALMEPNAALWIAWPKKASRRPTDITEDVVREIALATRLVDTKVAAVDEIWSGLRLTIRVEDRA